MLKFILFLSALLSSTITLAQGAISAGDGGHGVLCQTTEFQPNSSASLELLDLFEARRSWHPGRNQISNTEDYALKTSKTYTCRIVRQVKRSFESMFGTSTDLSRAFDEACRLNLKFVDDLPMTTDVGQVQTVLPKNCEIVQI